MKYLFVLRGISASGKSSFIQKHKLEAVTLSSDDYRMKLANPTFGLVQGGYIINQQVTKLAWQNLYQDLEYRMQHGELTIVDATHLTKDSLTRYKKLCKKYYYRMYVVEFNGDKKTCIERDSKRGFKRVGASIIENMELEPLPNSFSILTPHQFIPFVNKLYRALDLNKYSRVHVVGDIHGCYSPLKTFMECYVNTDKDAVVFVGDYFDRGIEEYEVFNFVYENIDKDNLYFLIGNHERKIMEYLRGGQPNNTIKYLQSKGVTDKMLHRLCKHLITCAYFTFKSKEFIVSHAGVPDTSISAFLSDDYFVNGVGSYEDMEKVCEYFAKNSPNNCIQVFGHRNNNNAPIKINNKCYNLCGSPEYGGDLRAITIQRDYIAKINMPNAVFSEEYFYNAINKYPDRFKVKDIPVLMGAFRHNKYVKETIFGDISSFQFTKDAFYRGHWSSITCKARGLFINTKTNQIVARSYDKFFLLNQYDYCTADKFIAPYTAYLKYDGFLGIIGYNDNELIFCSKSTLAPHGQYANIFKAHIEPLIKDKEGLLRFLKKQNCSMIFECIAPAEDSHVIKYGNNKMVFLDIVSSTLEYHKPFKYHEYADIVSQFFGGVHIKDKLHFFTTLSEDFIKYLKRTEGIEGFVIEDGSGKMFKLKTYDFEVAKLLQLISDNYKKIKEQANGHDIKCSSADKIRSRYREFYDEYVVEKVCEKVPEVIDKINEEW